MHYPNYEKQRKLHNPFEIVKEFELAVAEYCGAPYCVAVNSCTNALFLALKYQYNNRQIGIEQPSKFNQNYNQITTAVEIPKFTYISVPMQIKHAGFDVLFRGEKWSGWYKLEPFPIWDSARRFTSNMILNIPIEPNYYYVCLSFHWSKILGIQQGGAILTNDDKFVYWARRARFDGRTEGVKPKDDPIAQGLGWHMYMSPEIAAEGLVRLMHLPKHNADLPNDDYPDLSKLELFK